MSYKRFVLSMLAAAGAVAAVNCGDASVEPTAPREVTLVAAGNSGSGGGLQVCLNFRATSTTMTIGRNGGTIKVGEHELRIPSGALTQNVRITASIRPELINRIHFEPDGLVFREPAELRMDFKNCPLPPKGIVYVSPNGQILEHLPTNLDMHGHEARSNISHFSDYALESFFSFSDHVVYWGGGTSK